MVKWAGYVTNYEGYSCREENQEKSGSRHLRN